MWYVLFLTNLLSKTLSNTIFQNCVYRILNVFMHKLVGWQDVQSHLLYTRPTHKTHLWAFIGVSIFLSLSVPWPLQLESLPFTGKVNSKAGYCFTNILLVIRHLVKSASWVPEGNWLPTIQTTIASIFGQFWLNTDCRIVLLNHITLSNISSVVAYYILMTIICISEPLLLLRFYGRIHSEFLCLHCASLGFERRPMAAGLSHGCKGWVLRKKPMKTIQFRLSRGWCAKQNANIFHTCRKRKKRKKEGYAMSFISSPLLKNILHVNVMALRILI